MIKIANLLKEIVNDSTYITEIGDASSKPYEWKLGSSYSEYETVYEFTTDLGTEYKVEITYTGNDPNKDSDKFEQSVLISFSVVYYSSAEEEDIENSSSGKGRRRRVGDVPSTQDNSPNKYYSSIITTNKGELYRVMATIAQIVQEFLKNNPKIKILIYEPAKKSSEQEFGAQRDMLYKAFIKQAFPSSQISKQGDNIIVKIK